MRIGRNSTTFGGIGGLKMRTRTNLQKIYNIRGRVMEKVVLGCFLILLNIIG